MLRIPVLRKLDQRRVWLRASSSSSYIRKTFIDYFVSEHGHKIVKSTSVVPLSDPTVPFVNAGMNQFKGVFLGTVDPPHPRVVNSQKCVRVGGKHNDLEIVGTDGHHHTFFEMLGNWSFGDYYKEEACKMAWDLLLGPYRLKPDRLLVTYFGGDSVIGLIEDRECRDIWRQIGIPAQRMKAQNASENFWEMGPTGPCGPCTEIHYINDDGTLTEIWNLVFIHCNREDSGKVVGLRSKHVDTGMGLERMAALLQGVPSNYDTDLFMPIIKTIEQNCKSVDGYKGRYGPESDLDTAYRRLADHARMISICLADEVFPTTSLNLKQIMRKSFKLCTDVFQNPNLLPVLYNSVVETLGDTYPELVSKEVQAKKIIEHEAEVYEKLRSDLKTKWQGLVNEYPEVVSLQDVELAGFALGYKEFKQKMAQIKDKIVPGDLSFKLYDTHGFQESLIERIAALNKFRIDKTGFWERLTQHRARHKAALKEQTSYKGGKYLEAMQKLKEKGVENTNDLPKYDYLVKGKEITFEPLTTQLVGILNEDLEWVDFLDPVEGLPYCLITKQTNFYSQEGGQASDSGLILLNNTVFNVDSVFKIRNYVFHKGSFVLNKDGENYVNNKFVDVVLKIDGDKRLKIMKNHTAVHLLNAALRQVLPDSGICQMGSGVTEKGLHLTLTVYGEKITHKTILDVQDLIRKAIEQDSPIHTRVTNGVMLNSEFAVTTIPGERYPENDLRVVSTEGVVQSKELCCGTHVPSTGYLQEFCITHVKGAGGNAPTVYALSGEAAKQAREQFCRAQKLQQVVDLLEPDRKVEEISNIKSELSVLCVGSGAPYGEHAECLTLLDEIQKRPASASDKELQSVAQKEVESASLVAEEAGRQFVVHFLRCSYLMHHDILRQTLASVPSERKPTMLIGCAGGVILAACHVPQSMVTESFTAERWMQVILPVFQAQIMTPDHGLDADQYAQMTATKVSLITCEQQVQDAMRVAIKFAQSHHKEEETSTKGRRQN